MILADIESSKKLLITLVSQAPVLGYVRLLMVAPSGRGAMVMILALHHLFAEHDAPPHIRRLTAASLDAS
jgi:hypothetical protein